MKLRIFLLYCIFWVSCDNVPNQSEEFLMDQTELTINQYADSILVHPEITAISIGVYFKDTKYSIHRGDLIKGQPSRPSNQTVYEIGSVTKTMIGTLVAKAELEGKLSIEDDIRIYLPEEYPNLEYEGASIQIKHLLTHTSRLPYFLPLDAGNLFTTLNDSIPFLLDAVLMNYSKEQFFEDLHTIIIDTMPGAVYEYSNAGAEIVGYILTKVYDKSLNELIKAYYGEEYKMLNTQLGATKDKTKKMARGHWLNNKEYSPILKNPLWGSAGNVCSTTEDLLNYVAFQLNENNPVVAKAQTVVYTDGKNKSVAYFWSVNKEEREGITYSHHGGTPGMQNWIYLFPEHNLGISVITNQSGPKTAGRLAHLIQQIFDELTQ